MAERIAHFTRTSLKSYTTTASSAAKTCSSLFFPTHTNFTTTTTSPSQNVETKKHHHNGTWLTLPPFTSTINPTSVAKQLSKPHSPPPQTEPTTALKWVLRCCPNIPRSLVQKLFRLRQVRRESCEVTSCSSIETEAQNRSSLKRVSAKDEMNLGDKIFLPISVKEFRSEKDTEFRSEKDTDKREYRCNADEVSYIQSIELYRDPAIIVVNKPPGMPVQGGIGIKNSLDDLAANYMKYGYTEPPRLVHRLDRDSSGILVLGRTQTTATILHSIFREKTVGASTNDTDNTKRTLQRRYWALVIGTPRNTKGFISAPLVKVVLDNGKSERITVADDTQSMPSQHAVTEYRVIDTPCHGYTWLELCPLTGRKHQLRVHCAEVLGTPIVGDYKYGWQAHRKWKPLPSLEPERSENLNRSKMLPFGLDLVSGSILEKQPHLHLHCKKMILPNISLALEYMQSSKNWDLSELQSLELAAPLPFHMQRSWDVLR